MACIMTKGMDLEKFMIISCDGSVIERTKTLKEAEERADAIGACGVVKILRLCTSDNGKMQAILAGSEEVVIETDYEEDVAAVARSLFD